MFDEKFECPIGNISSAFSVCRRYILLLAPVFTPSDTTWATDFALLAMLDFVDDTIEFSLIISRSFLSFSFCVFCSFA